MCSCSMQATKRMLAHATAHLEKGGEVAQLREVMLAEAQSLAEQVRCSLCRLRMLPLLNNLVV